MQWDALTDAVRTSRRAGTVTMLTIARPEGVPARGAADMLAEAAHYTPIGSGWTPLSREQAESLLAYVLTHDLAYRAETMSADRATELASAFVDLAGPEAEFLTNGSTPDAPAASWAPISEATFDTGVVAVAASHVAMLWVEDED